MKKNLGIVVGALVLLIAAGALYYYWWGSNEVTMAREAIAGDGSASCTFEDANTGDEGTLYVQDGDARLTAETEEQTTDSTESTGGMTKVHMLFREDTIYVWRDDEEQGLELPSEGGEDLGILSNYDDEEAFRSEFKEQSFSCKRGVDEEQLELPDDVEFSGSSSAL